DGEMALSREPTLEDPSLGLRPTEPAVNPVAALAAVTAAAEAPTFTPVSSIPVTLPGTAAPVIAATPAAATPAVVAAPPPVAPAVAAPEAAAAPPIAVSRTRTPQRTSLPSKVRTSLRAEKVTSQPVAEALQAAMRAQVMPPARGAEKPPALPGVAVPVAAAPSPSQAVPAHASSQ